MEKNHEAFSLRRMIIVAILATAFSSLTLWLLESWIKYPLFLFEVVTIIAFYLIVSGYEIKTTYNQLLTNLPFSLIIDLSLIFSC
jgi:hypothetical protein